MPPQQRIDEHWYQGTADAVYQNIYTLEKERPEYVVILAGDHIYKMDYNSLVEYHKDNRGRPDRRRPAGRRRGVARTSASWRSTPTSASSASKKSRRSPKTIPGDPQHIFASMGIYVFTARFLFEQLCLDATRPGSAHDFGRNIIPSIIDTHRVFAFPFRDENRKRDAYWRDVGTLDAYFEANMDLISVDPLLNMYDEHWPIRTYQPNYPPPKFVFAEETAGARRGQALDSIVCHGSIISGGQVEAQAHRADHAPVGQRAAGRVASRNSAATGTTQAAVQHQQRQERGAPAPASASGAMAAAFAKLKC